MCLSGSWSLATRQSCLHEVSVKLYALTFMQNIDGYHAIICHLTLWQALPVFIPLHCLAPRQQSTPPAVMATSRPCRPTARSSRSLPSVSSPSSTSATKPRLVSSTPLILTCISLVFVFFFEEGMTQEANDLSLPSSPLPLLLDVFFVYY